MSEKLKPCPMCGGKAYYRNTIEFTSVRCRSCQLETKLHNDQEGALCAWNRRVNHIVDVTEKVPDHGVDATNMIPEGYVLVPVEPTEDMVFAGYDATRDHDGHPQFANAGFCLGHAGDIYRSMIKAAQKEDE